MPDWPHAPPHRLLERGAYIVTTGTYRRQPFLKEPERRDLVCRKLLEFADEYEWRMQAWAVLSNHYNFVALSPEDPKSLSKFVSKLHTLTAREFNLQDDAQGRKVWHQYYDTEITNERSYFSRLHYVHQNPVKHRLAENGRDYPWCSASWFEQKAPAAHVKTVYSFKIDRVQVIDNF